MSPTKLESYLAAPKLTSYLAEISHSKQLDESFSLTSSIDFSFSFRENFGRCDGYHKVRLSRAGCCFDEHVGFVAC